MDLYIAISSVVEILNLPLTCNAFQNVQFMVTIINEVT